MPITPPGQTRERVYRFVRERLLAGSPPTIREVQRAFHFRAVETARGHLMALVQEGRLAKRDGARGFVLPELDLSQSSGPSRLVPILGNVQAGDWNTAVQELDGYVCVETAESPESLFGLRVHGESMLLAGILPGDLVIVRRQPSASSGDIVVALVDKFDEVDEQATVKRLRLRRGRVELHPENPDFEVLIPPRDQVQILGKVIEVRRYLTAHYLPTRSQLHPA